MKILRKGRPIFGKVAVCDTVLKKIIGLMGRRRPLAKGECLLFVERKERSPFDMSIHMAFCFFPIKVAWLDGAGRVVGVQTAEPFSLFRPASWRLYSPPAPSRYIIECSVKEKLKVGDKLEIVI